MEKLIELLNEYSKNIGYFNEEDLQGQTKAWILSKEFGWIGWLVENDKIDFDKVSKKEIENRVSIVMVGVFIETNWVLMLLSIQDKPIEFLISILKNV